MAAGTKYDWVKNEAVATSRLAAPCTGAPVTSGTGKEKEETCSQFTCWHVHCRMLVSFWSVARPAEEGVLGESGRANTWAYSRNRTSVYVKIFAGGYRGEERGGGSSNCRRGV